jgi:hypothetical protein
MNMITHPREVFSKEASSIFLTKRGKLELEKKNREYSLSVAA